MTTPTVETVELDSPWTHPNLAAALAAFQAELPEIKKGNTAQVRSDKGNYSYDYADLADISPVVLRRLGEHGLSWTTSPTIIPDLGFVLTYELLHESGETREGIYPLPASNTPAQQLGSAITYARRYTLCAVTGVAPGGDDDDAQAAEQAQAARPQPAGKKAAPRQKPIVPPQPTRDWVAEANQITDLDGLTALAEEADRAGELGLKAGEGRVIDGLKARRDQLERAAAADVDPNEKVAPGVTVGAVAKANAKAPAGRRWADEARAMTTWPEVRSLLEEAKAAGVAQPVLDEIMQHGDALPDPSAPIAASSDPIPFPDPAVGWDPPSGDVA